MATSPTYTKYTFRERSGGIVDPRVTTVSHSLLGIGHTALIPPWKDPFLHCHQDSEEFYLLLQGELDLYIAGSYLTLKPNELLMVLPRVPHAVIGGRGPIEYFGFRAPCLNDKIGSGEIPEGTLGSNEAKQELQAQWGCHIPLTAAENQNCWLIGAGMARYHSEHLILAYLNFTTTEAANAGIGTRLRMHYHQKSWEYYTVIAGRKVLQIENELITVEAGEIVEVHPNVWHNVHSRQAPYLGFTIRVPILGENDKVEDQGTNVAIP